MKWASLSHISRIVMYLAIFVVVALVVAWFYRLQPMHELTRLEENKNISFTTSLTNSMWSEFSPLLDVPPRTPGGVLWDPARIERLNTAILSKIKDLSVIKVKIYSMQGITIFSTDLSQIGQDKSDTRAFISARAGNPNTVMTDQRHYSTFGGEVYDDVTKFIDRIEYTARNLSIITAISLCLLYLFFSKLLRHGNRKNTLPHHDATNPSIRKTHSPAGLDGEPRETIEALRRSEAQLKPAAKTAKLGHWTCNELGRTYVDFSEEYAHIHGYEIATMSRKCTTFEQQHRLIYFEDKERCLNAYNLAKRTKEFSVEYRVLRHDGAIRHVRRIGVITTDNKGRVVQSRGTLQDITQAKLAEIERLAHAQHQHEILTREMHHRIKNNLQGIIGLLHEYHQDDPRLAGAIGHVAFQVKTIARVHELQAGHRQETVQLGDLVKSITHAAVAHASINVSFDSTLMGTSLAEKESTPIALIINELVTNAIKHASRVAPDTANLSVALEHHDSGAQIKIESAPGSLPHGFDFERGIRVGNGLELVKLLLPENSSAISFFEHNNRVVASLVLKSPVVVRST